MNDWGEAAGAAAAMPTTTHSAAVRAQLNRVRNPATSISRPFRRCVLAACAFAAQHCGWDAAPIARLHWPSPARPHYAFARRQHGRDATMTVSQMNRRAMLRGATALGALAATSGELLAQGPRRTPPLPMRREFVIRNATVLTMDPNIADLARGDVHVRNGAIVAVGPRLNTRARAIDANGMICMPGIVDTHWHLWTTLFRLFVRADVDA